MSSLLGSHRLPAKRDLQPALTHSSHISNQPFRLSPITLKIGGVACITAPQAILPFNKGIAANDQFPNRGEPPLATAACTTSCHPPPGEDQPLYQSLSPAVCAGLGVLQRLQEVLLAKLLNPHSWQSQSPSRPALGACGAPASSGLSTLHLKQLMLRAKLCALQSGHIQSPGLMLGPLLSLLSLKLFGISGST
eukprot:CAMPEP_0117663500 /NCGR_PEP_ID=MMETSP0804-20121206/8644_1 /TAXON_ID=1074897 /ORGANISM="Tetraselmis astigmatica, Strain CCMP880" /LENGTH=192 /DNA_ID=CAMNT_0005470519 /DNA_START=75 /DNA_END=654 /DNA_ORIENTATION=-